MEHKNSRVEQLGDYMTVKAVAEAGGVSMRRVQELCQNGRIDAFKFGGIWLILEQSAYYWVNSPRKTGRPPLR